MSLAFRQLLPAIALILSLHSCGAHYSLVRIDGTSVQVDSVFDPLISGRVTEIIGDYQSDLAEEMSPVLGTSAAVMLSAAPRDYNVLANTVADILRDAASGIDEDVAFAVINVGGLRCDLPAGPISVGTAFELLPFTNTMCIVTLHGDAVLELFGQIALMGGEGVSEDVNLTVTADGRLLDARIDGVPVDGDADYRVATIDFVAEGNDGMTAFKKASGQFYPDDCLFRDIFIRHVRRLASHGQALQPKTDRRIFVK